MMTLVDMKQLVGSMLRNLPFMNR